MGMKPLHRLGLAAAGLTLAAGAYLGLHGGSSPVDPEQTGIMATGSRCGVERWAVKTLSDRDAAKVNLKPFKATVEGLRGLKAPKNLGNSRIGPVEFSTYTVDAEVDVFKLEADRDIHLVIHPVGKPLETMIVEFPDPTCAGAASSVQAGVMQHAREAFISYCGPPSPAWSPCPFLAGVTVHVTGVGFFDKIHGQRGVAPNGIELHPCLEFIDP